MWKRWRLAASSGIASMKTSRAVPCAQRSSRASLLKAAWIPTCNLCVRRAKCVGAAKKRSASARARAIRAIARRVRAKGNKKRAQSGICLSRRIAFAVPAFSCNGVGLQLSYKLWLEHESARDASPSIAGTFCVDRRRPFLSFRFLEAFALFQAFERRDLT